MAATPASGSQGPPNGGNWLSQYLRERNTFLEPIDPNAQNHVIRRQNSEPSLSSATSVSDESSYREPSGPSGSFDRVAKGIWGRQDRSHESRKAPVEYSSNSVPQATNNWQHVVYDTSSSSHSVSEATRSVKLENSRDLLTWDGGWGNTGPGNLPKPNRAAGADLADSDDDDEVGLPSIQNMSPAQLADLRGRIPVDEQGRQTSIGSLAHQVGRCIPCQQFATMGSCGNGTDCMNCHFAHSKKAGSRQCKPGKPKRERYRKFVSEVMQQIEADPYNFDPGAIVIPASIAPTEVLKRKFMSRVLTHIDYVKANRENGGEANLAAAFPQTPPPGGASPKPTAPVLRGKVKMSL